MDKWKDEHIKHLFASGALIPPDDYKQRQVSPLWRWIIVVVAALILFYIIYRVT